NVVRRGARARNGDFYIGVEPSRVGEEAHSRRGVPAHRERQAPDTCAGQIIYDRLCVGRAADDRHSSRPQTFLRDAARNDNLAAVALDLAIAQTHCRKLAPRRAYSITFFSIGSTVTPACRSQISARSIWSRLPSNSTATRPISS